MCIKSKELEEKEREKKVTLDEITYFTPRLNLKGNVKEVNAFLSSSPSFELNDCSKVKCLFSSYVYEWVCSLIRGENRSENRISNKYNCICPLQFVLLQKVHTTSVVVVKRKKRRRKKEKKREKSWDEISILFLLAGKEERGEGAEQRKKYYYIRSGKEHSWLPFEHPCTKPLVQDCNLS